MSKKMITTIIIICLFLIGISYWVIWVISDIRECNDIGGVMLGGFCVNKNVILENK